jgi:hypothetical protein
MMWVFLHCRTSENYVGRNFRWKWSEEKYFPRVFFISIRDFSIFSQFWKLNRNLIKWTQLYPIVMGIRWCDVGQGLFEKEGNLHGVWIYLEIFNQQESENDTWIFQLKIDLFSENRHRIPLNFNSPIGPSKAYRFCHNSRVSYRAISTPLNCQ